GGRDPPPHLAANALSVRGAALGEPRPAARALLDDEVAVPVEVVRARLIRAHEHAQLRPETLAAGRERRDARRRRPGDALQLLLRDRHPAGVPGPARQLHRLAGERLRRDDDHEEAVAADLLERDARPDAHGLRLARLA